MRVLFVENDDSFSYNVLDLVHDGRRRVRIVRGGGLPAPQGLGWADVLVIGPGPRDPERVGLVELVRRAGEVALPTLGLCLGHQAVAMAFGARLMRSVPCHGKTATAHFAESLRFPGINGPLEVMRYHSLSVVGVSLPLRVVARLGDGTVMAIEHDGLPMAGLQFHPDSYATPRGRSIVEAFFTGIT